MSSLEESSPRAQHIYVWEEKSGRYSIEMSSLEECPPRAHSTFTSGKKSGRYCIDMSSLEESSPRAHSTFTSGKEEWAAVSRDDVDGKSHCYELTSTESSNFSSKTYELPDDNIITSSEVLNQPSFIGKIA